MSSGPRSWRSAWLPVGLWLAAIFGASSIPNVKVPEVGLGMADKLVHVGEYAVLGFLLGRARRPGPRGLRALLGGGLLGLVVGTLDEFYQRSTPGRESTALDAVADVVGASLGAWVWSAWAARSRTPGQRDGQS